MIFVEPLDSEFLCYACKSDVGDEQCSDQTNLATTICEARKCHYSVGDIEEYGGERKIRRSLIV